MCFKSKGVVVCRPEGIPNYAIREGPMQRRVEIDLIRKKKTWGRQAIYTPATRTRLRGRRGALHHVQLCLLRNTPL